jgi:hypothetical protein
MSRVIELDAWKGKSGVEITHGNDDYLLVSYRKNKESGEITRYENRVPVSIVDNMRGIIRRAIPINGVLSYRGVVEAIKKDFNLAIPTDAWNGGSNRAKYYFPLYYWPIKVLEHEGYVSYNSRGSVKRLR